jgi:hypothetical protein
VVRFWTLAVHKRRPPRLDRPELTDVSVLHRPKQADLRQPNVVNLLWKLALPLKRVHLWHSAHWPFNATFNRRASSPVAPLVGCSWVENDRFSCAQRVC